MNGDRISLDTNVLVYAVDRNAGEKHARAARLVDAAVDWDCVLALQVLNEFFAATTGKDKLPLADSIAQIEDWLRLFSIRVAGPNTLRRAMGAVRAHRFSFWDALLWATVREAGVTLMLTEDFQHGRVLGGVRFHNPFQEEVPLPPPE